MSDQLPIVNHRGGFTDAVDVDERLQGGGFVLFS